MMQQIDHPEGFHLLRFELTGLMRVESVDMEMDMRDRPGRDRWRVTELV